MRARLLLVLLLGLSCNAAAQQPFWRDLVPGESGGSPVAAVATDAWGRIWTASGDGLHYYNGRVFVRVPDSAQAPATALTAAGGTLYIGYADGTVRARTERGIRLLGRLHAPVSSILPVSSGILVGTRGDGLALLLGGLWYHANTARGLADDYVYDLAAGPGGQVAVATDRGCILVAQEPAPPYRLHMTAAGAGGSGPITDIARAVRYEPGTGRLWVGTEEQGVGCFRSGYGTLHSAGPLPGSPVVALAPGAAGSVWCGTENGTLLHIRWRGAVPEVRRWSFPAKRFRSLVRDGGGNIWIATSTGLLFVTAAYLQHLDFKPAYRLAALSAVACTEDGRVLISQDNQLLEYRPGQALRLLKALPAPVTCLHPDGQGRVWAGTLGAGLWCCDARGRWTSTAAVLGSGHILSVSSKEDTLWVASLEGVAELQAAGGVLRPVRRHGAATGLGSDYVYQLYRDSRGRMWLATDGAGLCLWDGRRYHRWDSAAGFAPRVCYTVVEDRAGGFWAGTLDGGLLRWPGTGRWTRVGAAGARSTVLSLGALGDGSVLAATASGVEQWYPAQQRARIFGRRYGVGIDSFSQALNVLATDRGEYALIPYQNGLLRLERSREPVDLKPRIVLHPTELFSRPVPGQAQFAPGEHTIGFSYEGIQTASPARIRYRYRLDGYNEDWVETNDERVVFPRLPAGRYRFTVQASDEASFRDPAETSRAFRIASPLWHRPLFWAGVLAVVAGGTFFSLRRRERALRHVARLQRERLIFENELLKSQVNPHFLFNSLNTLADLIEEAPAAATEYTLHLSDFYRNTLAFRETDAVPLAEEWTVLEQYLHIQKTRFGAALHWAPQVPEEALHRYRIVPLALQLLVENALKHNVATRADPLVISVTVQGDVLTVCNPIRPKATLEPGTGLGLDNIRRRYALLTRRPVGIDARDGVFSVRLPLL